MSANDPVARGPIIFTPAQKLIDSKPTFRESFEQRRGLLIVKTFNEGEEITSARRCNTRSCSRGYRQPLAIAVIWERWINAKDDGNTS